MQHGQQAFSQRDFAAAASQFDRAVSADRGRYEGWVNLGVCQLELGQADTALHCLQRAAALAPAQPMVLQLLGDALRAASRGDEAIAAYRRSLALAPSADAHNKLGCLLRSRWQLADAEQALRQAQQADPNHPYAAVNLGTLLVLRGRFDEARALLQAELAKLIPPDAYDEAARALRLLDERDRLEPVLAGSFASGEFAPMIAALQAAPAPLLEPDAEVMAFLEALTLSAQSIPAAAPAPAYGTHAEWPWVEAHFSMRRGDALADYQASRAGGPEGGSADEPADKAADGVARYADTVLRRRTPDFQRLYDSSPETALRYAHWLLMPADEAATLQPGQFKLQPNEVVVNARVPRAAPDRVVGTLRRVFDELLPTLANADARAGLVFMAILRCHCFLDGNGRVARLFANLEIERGGLAPIVFPAELRAVWVERLFNPVYTQRSMAPLLAFFAECRAFSARFMERLP